MSEDSQAVSEVGAVDVVLLTLNSQRRLRECLESVYRNVPVHRLIVVDGGSTDQTHTILAGFNEKHGNIEVFSDRGNRATARQRGIREVSTEWFLFVDSDVVLCDGWFKKAQRHISPEVGAVWGTEIWSAIGHPNTLKLFLQVTRKILEVRGGTHDTLIRTSLVKDIAIPKQLHIYEDKYIKDWVEAKGYRVVACYVPFCIHYRPQKVWTVDGSLGLIAEAFTIGNPRLISRLLPAYGFYTVYAFYQLV